MVHSFHLSGFHQFRQLPLPLNNCVCECVRSDVCIRYFDLTLLFALDCPALNFPSIHPFIHPSGITGDAGGFPSSHWVRGRSSVHHRTLTPRVGRTWRKPRPILGDHVNSVNPRWRSELKTPDPDELSGLNLMLIGRWNPLSAGTS